MARKQMSRALPSLDRLPEIYDEECVAEIARVAGLPAQDIRRLRQSIIAAVAAYIELEQQKRERIRKGRSQKTARARFKAKTGAVAWEDGAVCPRRGRPSEAPSMMLASALAGLYARHGGRRPTRIVDWDTGEQYGEFQEFVAAALRLLKGEQYTAKALVRRYIEELLTDRLVIDGAVGSSVLSHSTS